MCYVGQLLLVHSRTFGDGVPESESQDYACSTPTHKRIHKKHTSAIVEDGQQVVAEKHNVQIGESLDKKNVVKASHRDALSHAEAEKSQKPDHAAIAENSRVVLTDKTNYDEQLFTDTDALEINISGSEHQKSNQNFTLERDGSADIQNDQKRDRELQALSKISDGIEMDGDDEQIILDENGMDTAEVESYNGSDSKTILAAKIQSPKTASSPLAMKLKRRVTFSQSMVDIQRSHHSPALSASQAPSIQDLDRQFQHVPVIEAATYFSEVSRTLSMVGRDPVTPVMRAKSMTMQSGYFDEEEAEEDVEDGFCMSGDLFLGMV